MNEGIFSASKVDYIFDSKISTQESKCDTINLYFNNEDIDNKLEIMMNEEQLFRLEKCPNNYSSDFLCKKKKK